MTCDITHILYLKALGTNIWTAQVFPARSEAGMSHNLFSLEQVMTKLQGPGVWRDQPSPSTGAPPRRAKRQQLFFKDFNLKAKAVSVLCVPYSLDSGPGLWRARRSPYVSRGGYNRYWSSRFTSLLRLRLLSGMAAQVVSLDKARLRDEQHPPSPNGFVGALRPTVGNTVGITTPFFFVY